MRAPDDLSTTIPILHKEDKETGSHRLPRESSSGIRSTYSFGSKQINLDCLTNFSFYFIFKELTAFA